MKRITILVMFLLLTAREALGAKLGWVVFSSQPNARTCELESVGFHFSFRHEIWFYAVVNEVQQGDLFSLELVNPKGQVTKTITGLPSTLAGSICISSPLRQANEMILEEGTWTTRGSGNKTPLFFQTFRVMPDSILVPSFEKKGIVNAASYQSGAVAPGEIITIFGLMVLPVKLKTFEFEAPGLLARELAGVRVLFDGVPAPILSIADRDIISGQISCIVPYRVAERSFTFVEVEIKRDNVRSHAIRVPVAEAAPGIFTVRSTGRDQGAILNQDASLNSASAPAGIGSVVSIYATGEGQTDPPGEDGLVTADTLPKPKAPVTVLIGNKEAEVLYAGAGPGMVAGLLQVNARVPEGLGSSENVPVVLKVGEAARSQSGVIMAVTALELASLTLSASTAHSGTRLNGTIRLNEPAPVAGVRIQLGSEGPVASRPAAVVVSGRNIAASFLIIAGQAAIPQIATLSASYAGITKIAQFTVLPPSAFTTRSRILIAGNFSTSGWNSGVAINLDNTGRSEGAFTGIVQGENEAKLISWNIYFGQARILDGKLEMNRDPQMPSFYTNVPEGFLLDPIISARLNMDLGQPVAQSGVSGTLRFSTRNKTIDGKIEGRIAVIQ